MRRSLLCTCRLVAATMFFVATSLAVTHDDQAHTEHRFGPPPMQTRNANPFTLETTT